MEKDIIAKRQQQVLHDKKWIRFLRRTWLFRWIPFVEFSLAAGSMATGKVSPGSDFDVIVGARSGRIFTARFFSVIAFGFFGWRRTKLDHKESATDKVCLNHFVTEKSYRLAPPHNSYWKDLYANLVPVFGDTGKIREFFDANKDWLDEARLYGDDLRHAHRADSRAKKFWERLLGGRFGEWVEKNLRAIQIARIERGLGTDSGYKPRIIYTDDELEFHPDTSRIELYK